MAGKILRRSGPDVQLGYKMSGLVSSCSQADVTFNERKTRRGNGSAGGYKVSPCDKMSPQSYMWVKLCASGVKRKTIENGCNVIIRDTRYVKKQTLARQQSVFHRVDLWPSGKLAWKCPSLRAFGAQKSRLFYEGGCHSDLLGSSPPIEDTVGAKTLGCPAKFWTLSFCWRRCELGSKPIRLLVWAAANSQWCLVPDKCACFNRHFFHERRLKHT